MLVTLLPSYSNLDSINHIISSGVRYGEGRTIVTITSEVVAPFCWCSVRTEFMIMMFYAKPRHSWPTIFIEFANKFPKTVYIFINCISPSFSFFCSLSIFINFISHIDFIPLRLSLVVYHNHDIDQGGFKSDLDIDGLANRRKWWSEVGKSEALLQYSSCSFCKDPMDI